MIFGLLRQTDDPDSRKPSYSRKIFLAAAVVCELVWMVFLAVMAALAA